MKIRYICCIAVFFLTFCSVSMEARAENITVVIDPGHGGENLGGQYDAYTEKDMTIITAAAMKEELEKYEGITVYMTREGDKELSLEERVEYAKSVHADFLFCLHYNMSVKHNLFGAEVWVSAFGEQYQKGYTFANVEMEMLTDFGLYSRGIKTKFNDRGVDYYGIIRRATQIQMPAVIIEHCHLDQDNDTEFYNSDEKMKQMGILDATAVAKYYGLKSDILGVDYGSYQNIEIPVPSSPVKPDKTPPDVCSIEVNGVDETTGMVDVTLYAQDYDNHMLYYSYSYNGGLTFSALQKWEPTDTDTIQFQMNVPSGFVPEIVVNAYNAFDGFTESNHIPLASMSYGEDMKEDASQAEAKPEQSYKDISFDNEQKNSDKGKEDKQDSVWYFIQVCFVCIAILIVLFLLAYIILSSVRGSKKKRRRRK